MIAFPLTAAKIVGTDIFHAARAARGRRRRAPGRRQRRLPRDRVAAARLDPGRPASAAGSRCGCPTAPSASRSPRRSSSRGSSSSIHRAPTRSCSAARSSPWSRWSSGWCAGSRASRALGSRARHERPHRRSSASRIAWQTERLEECVALLPRARRAPQPRALRGSRRLRRGDARPARQRRAARAHDARLGSPASPSAPDDLLVLYLDDRARPRRRSRSAASRRRSGRRSSRRTRTGTVAQLSSATPTAGTSCSTGASPTSPARWRRVCAAPGARNPRTIVRSVARSASVALVAALLIATGAAFAYTERLKLTPSPILGTSVTKVFSPVCDCDTDVALVQFKLRKADRIDVEIIDAERRSRPTPHAEPGRAAGSRDDRLERARRPWRGRSRGVVSAARAPRAPAPHHHAAQSDPGRRDPADGGALRRRASRVLTGRRSRATRRVVVGYRVSEPAAVSLYVDGEAQVLKRGQKPEGGIRLVRPRRRGARAARHLHAPGRRDGSSRATSPSAAGGSTSSFATSRSAAKRIRSSRASASPSSSSPTPRGSDGGSDGRTGVARPGTLRLRAP